MKIAVTYENGEIFQHFGHSEAFKLYDVEEGRVVSAEVIDSNGSGHGALAGLLADNRVDVLICGGIGGGAQAALMEKGIELCSGITGDADEAVEAYLKGELESAGVNCDHHDNEHGQGHSCGDGGHCENHETSPCGHCSGCGPQIQPIGKNAGKTCRVHYRGTLDDGTQFDSSYDRGEPLEFICGAGMMIPGFDKAVAEMEIGQIIDVHLEPEEAYGMPDPNAFLTINVAQMPGSEELTVGEQVYLTNNYGQTFPVTVAAREDDMITFDANHEMAGLALNFTIELVSME